MSWKMRGGKAKQPAVNVNALGKSWMSLQVQIKYCTTTNVELLLNICNPLLSM